MAERWHLGIDTATPWLALALWSPEAAHTHRHEVHLGRAMAGRLLVELDALLTRAGVGRHQLAAVGVGTGPGSYTGTRIGVATGSGLARALGVPIGGSSTLAALALAGLADGEEGWAVTPAQGQDVHAARYRRSGDDVVLLVPSARRPRAELTAGGTVVEGRSPDASLHARRASHGVPPDPAYG